MAVDRKAIIRLVQKCLIASAIALMSLLRTTCNIHAEPKSTQSTEQQEQQSQVLPKSETLTVLLLTIVGFSGVLLVIAYRKRCPRCGWPTRSRRYGPLLPTNAAGYQARQVHDKCSHCDWEWTYMKPNLGPAAPPLGIITIHDMLALSPYQQKGA